MANESNLRVPTSEEAREIGRKGGLASARSRQARKTLKEELLLLLSEGDVQKSVTAALIKRAQSGDVKAFAVLRDTIGEAPTINIGVGAAGDELKNLSDEQLRKMAESLTAP